MLLSRRVLRSSSKALVGRTARSSQIRAFGGGGDGHFQPPFVQRARDTRKVGFVFLVVVVFCVMWKRSSVPKTYLVWWVQFVLILGSTTACSRARDRQIIHQIV